MSESLLSVGLDVGTTTTQLILSRITAENRASGFAVPQMEITGREVVYRGPIHFTPLLGGELVDGSALRELVTEEYRRGGIRREDVDTGAVIITGETSRKENAQAVLSALSEFAGEFVVATAGPDLESVLAAKGAGAVDYSERTGKRVLHMDIGGGTSNLALIEEGTITYTACLNVGGRLVKFGKDGTVTYVSPVLRGLDIREGECITREKGEQLAAVLAQVLEMAADRKPRGELLSRFSTQGATPLWEERQENLVLSFSGGVADCIAKPQPWDAYGDLGPLLGQAIRNSSLCRGTYRLGEETIRATVIGAGCHSAQLSGSTVFYKGITFPLKNLPVAALRPGEQQEPGLSELLRRRLDSAEGAVVLALPGWESAEYGQICALADQLAGAVGRRPCYVAVEADMAKALGNALALRLPEDTPILCIDRVRLPQGSYLDVGAPVGPALPVVIKTLILETQ